MAMLFGPRAGSHDPHAGSFRPRERASVNELPSAVKAAGDANARPESSQAPETVAPTQPAAKPGPQTGANERGTPQYAANWQAANDAMHEAVNTEGTQWHWLANNQNAPEWDRIYQEATNALSRKYGVLPEDLERATAPEITKPGDTQAAPQAPTGAPARENPAPVTPNPANATELPPVEVTASSLPSGYEPLSRDEHPNAPGNEHLLNPEPAVDVDMEGRGDVPKRKWVKTGRKDSRGQDIYEPTMDYSRDGLLEWLAASGGLNFKSLRQAADADPALFKSDDVMYPLGKVGMPALRRNGGMNVEQLYESMRDDGWFTSEPDGRPTEVGAREAADMVLDALNGKKIYHPYEGAEDRMLRDAADYEREMAKHDAEMAADREAMTEAERTDAAQAMREEGITGDEESLTLAQWLQAALDSGAPMEDIERAISMDTNAGAVRRLSKIINENRHGNDNRATQEASDAGEAAPGSRSAATGAEAREQGFSLQSPEQRPEQEPRVEQQQGLFAPPTASERNRAAVEAKDAERNGKTGGREDTGDGGLFDGERPEQVDLTNAKVNDTFDPVERPDGEFREEDLTPEERALVAQARSGQARAKEKAEADAAERELGEQMRQENADLGARESDQLGLKRVTDAMFPDQDVTFVHDEDGVDPAIRRRLRPLRRGHVRKAFYDPRTRRTYVLTKHTRTPEDAAWAVAHEIGGHKAFRSWIDKYADTKVGNRTAREALNAATDLARQNPTVARLADVIRRGRGETRRGVDVEEALAELQAASLTGDFDRIRSRYGVDVPEAMRPSLKRSLANYVRRITRILNAIFKRETGHDGTFTDEDVRDMLAHTLTALDGRKGRLGERGEVGKDVVDDEPLFSEEYLGNHRPPDPEDGFPLHDLTGGGEGYPSDVYSPSGTRLYGHGGSHKRLDEQAMQVIRRMRNHPNAEVTIYRAIPKGATDAIHPGDWVTITRGYAVEHGEGPLGGQYDIVSKKVRADQVYTSADSLHEYGYWPDGAKRYADSHEGLLESVEPDDATGRALDSIITPKGEHEYSDGQKEFLRKAGLSKPRKNPVKRALAAMGRMRQAELGDRFRQSSVNQLHGLERAVARHGNIPPELDPAIAADMIQTSMTMEGVMRFGAPELRGGLLRVKRDGPEGLLPILSNLNGHLTEWLGWKIAKRAQRLMAEGRENNFSLKNIHDGLRLGNGHEEVFEATQREYRRLDKAILDLAQASGLINPDTRAMWEDPWHVPFYRMTEGGFTGPGTTRGYSRQTAGIRQLRGGEDILNDPMSNILGNWSHLIDAATKNRVLLLAVDQLGDAEFGRLPYEFKNELIPMNQLRKHLLEAGVDEKVIDSMPREALQGMRKLYAMKPPEGDNVVRVMRNGKPEYYEVKDPLLYRSLTALHESPAHMLTRILAWQRHLLTAGITLDPTFIVRNASRDTFDAALTSDERFIPIWDTMRGIYDDLRETDLTRDLMMSGAAFKEGYYRTDSRTELTKSIKRTLRRYGKDESLAESIAKTMINPKRMWDVYNRVRESTEMGSRVQLAKNKIKAGDADILAFREAKDFLNFQRRGDNAILTWLFRVTPFLNARVQGLDRLYRVGVKSPRKRRAKVATRLAMMATTSLVLMWWNEKHYKEAYDELPEWDKDAYWHFAPGTPYHVRFPKPFEMGILGGTVPERAYRAIQYQVTQGASGDTPEETWDSFMRAITGTLSLEPPSAITPPLEVAVNKDFYFGNKIEPDKAKFQLPKDTYSVYTSPLMREVSKGTSHVLGNHGLGGLVGTNLNLSPRQLEFLWNNYTGSLGRYALGAADAVVRALKNEPAQPSEPLGRMPVLKAFYRGDVVVPSKYMDEFYDILIDAQTARNTIYGSLEHHNAGRARNVAKNKRWLLGEPVDSGSSKYGFVFAGMRYLNKVRDELADIRHQRAAIYANRTMSPKAKRAAVDKLTKQQNAIARKAVRMMRERKRKFH